MSSNIFAALQKPSKKLSLKGDAPVETKAKKHAELEKAIFSAPAAAVSNWADDSDEDWETPSREVSENEDGWNQARLVASRNSHMRLADLQLDETDEAQEEDVLDPEVRIKRPKSLIHAQACTASSTCRKQ
jgi:hypothetical protein